MWQGGGRNDETDGLCQFNIVAGDIAKRQRLMCAILAVAEPRPLNCADEDVAAAGQRRHGVASGRTTTTGPRITLRPFSGARAMLTEILRSAPAPTRQTNDD